MMAYEHNFLHSKVFWGAAEIELQDFGSYKAIGKQTGT